MSKKTARDQRDKRVCVDVRTHFVSFSKEHQRRNQQQQSPEFEDDYLVFERDFE